MRKGRGGKRDEEGEGRKVDNRRVSGCKKEVATGALLCWIVEDKVRKINK